MDFLPAERVVYNEKSRDCTFFSNQIQYKFMFEVFEKPLQVQFRIVSLVRLDTFDKTVSREMLSEIFLSSTIKNSNKFTQEIESLIKKRNFSFVNNDKSFGLLRFRKKLDDEEFAYVDIKLPKLDLLEQEIQELQSELNSQTEKVNLLETKVDDKLDLIIEQMKKLRDDVQDIRQEKCK